MNKIFLSNLLIIMLMLVACNPISEEFELDSFKVKLIANPHKITLLNSGIAAFEARLEMMERAKESIEVEYFIYKSDLSGKLFTQTLINKAKEGVKVRLLLDTFMVRPQITEFYIHELKDAGIEVRFFNNSPKLSLVKGMYRNHRKLIIVDGKEIITGGRNIGDEYFDLSKEFNFLDRDILVVGDIVKVIKNSFDIIWNSKAVVKIDRPEMPKFNDTKYSSSEGDSYSYTFKNDIEFWKEQVQKAKNFLKMEENEQLKLQEIRDLGTKNLAESYTGTCENIGFESEFPIISKINRSRRIIKNELFDRISNAKEKILIDSPYFVVDKYAGNALDNALENNVKIDLLTNSLFSTDAIYVFDVFKSIIKGWIKKGLVAHTFKGQRPENYQVLNTEIGNARFGVHSKTFVFDNKDTIIGTYNFDPRSENYNAEMIISCDDNFKFAEEVTKDFEQRTAVSFKLDTIDSVDENAFYKVGVLKKIAYGILKIPANLFDYLL